MNLASSLSTCLFHKYFDFNGRADRSEYWWFMFFYSAVYFGIPRLYEELYFSLPPLLMTVPAINFIDAAHTLLTLILIPPACAVQVRRLHDIDKKGWLIFLTFIPAVGSLILFFFSLMSGTEGPNSYGPNPLDGGKDSTPEAATQSPDDAEAAADTETEAETEENSFKIFSSREVRESRPVSRPDYGEQRHITNNSDYRQHDMRDDCINRDRKFD